MKYSILSAKIPTEIEEIVEKKSFFRLRKEEVILNYTEPDNKSAANAHYRIVVALC